MNTQKAKQANEMTNKELFDELKERGFFLMPENPLDDRDFDTFVVSVDYPKYNVFYNRKVGIENRKLQDYLIERKWTHTKS